MSRYIHIFVLVITLVLSLIHLNYATSLDYERKFEQLLIKHLESRIISGIETSVIDYNKLTDSHNFSALVEQAVSIDVEPLSTNQQKAFYLNIYHLALIQHIVNLYPIQSVADVNAASKQLTFYNQICITINNQNYSLDAISNQIKTKFNDPRMLTVF